MLSNAERILCSRKCILMKSKASSGFLKTILALWGLISRLLVGRLNSERNLESIDFDLFLFKDKNFLPLTPFICSQTK